MLVGLHYFASSLKKQTQKTLQNTLSAFLSVVMCPMVKYILLKYKFVTHLSYWHQVDSVPLHALWQ